MILAISGLNQQNYKAQLKQSNSIMFTGDVRSKIGKLYMHATLHDIPIVSNVTKFCIGAAVKEKEIVKEEGVKLLKTTVRIGRLANGDYSELGDEVIDAANSIAKNIRDWIK